MIISFMHKGLEELFYSRKTRLIDAQKHKRIIVRLAAIDMAKQVTDLNISGFNFHSLIGFQPTRYTIHVNGPWCITFEFDDSDAFNLDFEQYH